MIDYSHDAMPLSVCDKVLPGGSHHHQVPSPKERLPKITVLALRGLAHLEDVGRVKSLLRSCCHSYQLTDAHRYFIRNKDGKPRAREFVYSSDLIRSTECSLEDQYRSPEFEKVISHKGTAMFFQIDRRVAMMIELQLASQVR